MVNSCSAGGTTEFGQRSRGISRPSGTRSRRGRRLPALKRWAIVSRPSGTGPELYTRKKKGQPRKGRPLRTENWELLLRCCRSLSTLDWTASRIRLDDLLYTVVGW